MMKMFTKTVAVVALSVGVAGLASAKVEVVAADDSASSKICVAAANGNKLKLHSAIKDAGVDKQYVYQEMTCNGMSVNEFVEQYGAE